MSCWSQPVSCVPPSRHITRKTTLFHHLPISSGNLRLLHEVKYHLKGLWQPVEGQKRHRLSLWDPAKSAAQLMALNIWAAI